MTKKAYSVSEAAEALSLGRTLVYELIKDGRLRTFHVGTRRLISADALSDFVRTQDADADSRRARAG